MFYPECHRAKDNLGIVFSLIYLQKTKAGKVLFLAEIRWKLLKNYFTFLTGHLHMSKTSVDQYWSEVCGIISKFSTIAQLVEH